MDFQRPGSKVRKFRIKPYSQIAVRGQKSAICQKLAMSEQLNDQLLVVSNKARPKNAHVGSSQSFLESCYLKNWKGQMKCKGAFHFLRGPWINLQQFDVESRSPDLRILLLIYERLNFDEFQHNVCRQKCQYSTKPILVL